MNNVLRTGLVLLGAMLGAVLLDLALELASSLNGGKAPWYATRAAGVIAYAALGLSTVWGLLTSSRLVMRWVALPLASELHKSFSFIGLAALGLHGVVLTYERTIPYSLAQIAVPFLSDYRPVQVGLGIITGYLMLALTASFYFRQHTGQKAWRAFHFTGFGAYILATVHGLTAGTDTTAFRMQIIYIASGAAVLFLTYVRILGGRYVPARKAQVQSPRTASSHPSINGQPIVAIGGRK